MCQVLLLIYMYVVGTPKGSRIAYTFVSMSVRALRLPLF
jgi:hypothetical protein